MANTEQVSRLLAGVAGWNEWRRVSNDIPDLDLMGANLTDADLTRANLTGVNLMGAHLTRVNLTGANLTGANLTWTNLTGANLMWTNLMGAHLTRANLRGANLMGANLTGTNLMEANLMWTNLMGTDLTEAQLTSTVLDPLNQPNGGRAHDHWTKDGEYLIGWRTRRPCIQGGPAYEDGKEYIAPVFSTCPVTQCHPGLYVCQTVEDVGDCEPGERIRVRFRREDLHSVGCKHRVRRFTVIGN